jgi:hypothetical protein
MHRFKESLHWFIHVFGHFGAVLKLMHWFIARLHRFFFFKISCIGSSSLLYRFKTPKFSTNSSRTHCTDSCMTMYWFKWFQSVCLLFLGCFEPIQISLCTDSRLYFLQNQNKAQFQTVPKLSLTISKLSNSHDYNQHYYIQRDFIQSLINWLRIHLSLTILNFLMLSYQHDFFGITRFLTYLMVKEPTWIAMTWVSLASSTAAT